MSGPSHVPSGGSCLRPERTLHPTDHNQVPTYVSHSVGRTIRPAYDRPPAPLLPASKVLFPLTPRVPGRIRSFSETSHLSGVVTDGDGVVSRSAGADEGGRTGSGPFSRGETKLSGAKGRTNAAVTRHPKRRTAPNDDSKVSSRRPTGPRLGPHSFRRPSYGSRALENYPGYSRVWRPTCRNFSSYWSW